MPSLLAERAPGSFIWFISFISLVWFVWFPDRTNETNKTNQLNQMNQIDQTNRLSDREQIGILQGREVARGGRMGIVDLLKFKRLEILSLAQTHGAHNVRIFGSVARGEAHADSDIDFLVEMDNGRSLLDLIELSQDLETLLQRKVEVLTDKGLSPYLEKRIHAEAVLL